MINIDWLGQFRDLEKECDRELLSEETQKDMNALCALVIERKLTPVSLVHTCCLMAGDTVARFIGHDETRSREVIDLLKGSIDRGYAIGLERRGKETRQ